MKKLLALLVILCMLLPCAAFAAKEDAKLAIVFANDIHGGVDDDIGYAGLSAFVKNLEAQGQDVILVDAGDSLQGAAIGTLSRGECLTDIMNKMGCDVAIPGNHEFDYGMERFLELAEMAEFPYISANFTDLRTGKSVFPAYVIKEAGGAKVAFVGVSTPKAITTSTPAYFQDEEGNYIYGFLQDQDGSGVYTAVQNAVDAARADGADYVICVGHLGIAADCSPWTAPELIENTTGIDVMIDGHSHSIIATRVLNKDGENVLHMQTGTKLENIGILTVSGGAIEGSIISDYTGKDPEMEAYIGKIKGQYNELLQEVVAHTDVDLVVYDPVQVDSEGRSIRLIRNSETNLGDLCADAYRTVSGADVAFVNGGAIRADITAGDVTYEQVIAVHPYGNMLTVVEATGQQILDCLEWGAHNVPGELGGFLQVSGLTYEIHSYIESSAQADADGMFTGVDGEYRVKNVMVNGEPLDPEKTYTVASHNYMIKLAGDGFTMFKDDTLLQDAVMLDNQVLINYIRDILGGVIGQEYGEIYGQDRIIFVTEEP